MYQFNIEPLRKKFEESRMTYRELAEESGVALNTVHRILSKPVSRPRIDHLMLICEVFNVSPRNLFHKVQ